MKTEERFFYSNGYKLRGALYLPEDYKEGDKLPCIIANSGYMGLNEIYPALFARALTARGYAVFGFDYRGFLDNEGPAGVCKLEEQVEDIRNAFLFTQTLTQVDRCKIALLGWGMAAALVMGAAAKEPEIKAVAGLNGFYCGERWLKMVYPYMEFRKLKDEVSRERTRFVREGGRCYDNPFHFYPLDPETDHVVQDNLYTVDGYGQEISLELGQSILEFDAERYVDQIAVPVFIAHGKNNLLHPLEESQQFYKKLNHEKKLLVLDGKHNDFMFDNHPVFEFLADELKAFFQEAMNVK